MYTYDVIDLGALPGGTALSPNAMNNNVVVGSSVDSTGAPRAISWKNGVLSQLPGPASARATSANDINRTGVIVGSFGDGQTSSQACKWVNGAFSAIPNGGTFASVADGINAAGTIVGWGQIGDAVRGRRWKQGNIEVLNSLGNNLHCMAHSVDVAGTVVGQSEAQGPFNNRAVRWNVNGAVSHIDGFPRNSVAFSIHSGVSVGALMSGGVWVPAHWSPGFGGMLGLFSGSTEGMALDVNRFGQIVGFQGANWSSLRSFGMAPWSRI